MGFRERCRYFNDRTAEIEATTTKSMAFCRIFFYALLPLWSIGPVIVFCIDIYKAMPFQNVLFGLVIFLGFLVCVVNITLTTGMFLSLSRFRRSFFVWLWSFLLANILTDFWAMDSETYNFPEFFYLILIPSMVYFHKRYAFFIGRGKTIPNSKQVEETGERTEQKQEDFFIKSVATEATNAQFAAFHMTASSDPIQYHPATPIQTQPADPLQSQPSCPTETKNAGFCRACGKPIDPESYQCTGCGKQYNKGKMLWKKSRAKGGRIVVGVLIVALAGVCVGQYSHYATSTKEMEEKILALEEDLEKAKTLAMNRGTQLSLTRTNWRQERRKFIPELEFFREHAAIVTSSGSKYHHYSCYHWQDASSFYIFNTEYAKSRGYTPCLDCWEDGLSLDIDDIKTLY